MGAASSSFFVSPELAAAAAFRLASFICSSSTTFPIGRGAIGAAAGGVAVG